MGAFENFLENLSFKGLEYFQQYYGVYRAKVADNKDPEKRGRIRLYSPELGQREAQKTWVDPAFDYAGEGHGSFWPPEENDFVRVAYAGGDTSNPIVYYGGWYIKGGVPEKLGHDEGGDEQTGTAPIKRGFVTKAGHALVFNDKADEESIELSWRDSSAKLTIDEKAAIKIETGTSFITIDKEGKKIEILDENQNTIVLDDKGVTIKTSKKVNIEGTDGVTIKGSTIDLDSSTVNLTNSSDEPAVKGQTLDTWLKSHTHGTGVGPSSPPMSPPPPAMLSQKAKVG